MSCACETPLKLGKISWDWGGGGYRLELLLLESFTPRVHHENDYVFLWIKNENYFTSMSHYCYSMPVEQNVVTMGMQPQKPKSEQALWHSIFGRSDWMMGPKHNGKDAAALTTGRATDRPSEAFTFRADSH